ncbi:MAG: GMC family oxidoreductase N-terminal domain-containing protein [Sphingomonadales bacterium]|nr:GMC family oxidoreductase N-terminal domain-containing protein [Sphingomonadales bacterium]
MRISTAKLRKALAIELTQDRGKRCSAALAYVTPAEKRKDLTIFKQAFVEKVLVEKRSGDRRDGRVKRQLAANQSQAEVILSYGAFQSP